MTTPPPATEAMEMPTLTEGDIYFWRWKDGHEPKLMGSRQYAYHCRACKAVVRHGLLIDTYWGDMTSDRAINLAEVDLEYQGNETTLVKINPWEKDYYEQADVVDMRHANHERAPVYIKPRTKRSKARVIELLEYRRGLEESKISSAQYNLTRIAEALVRANADNLEGYFP